MESERWRRVEEILGAALEQPAAARETFVARACGDDQPLRREVLSLLQADDRAVAADFLAPPPAARPEDRDPEPPAARIGPYRLVRKLGEGGMSVVFLAEREDEHYRRRVAIKLLRSAFASEHQRARFRAERQILAGLDHPGIARLYDGGTTGEGLPYFVLEHVEGEPIDAFCDRQRLTVRERLELFCTVCAAVHYAHQSLVVHRDLKPGNILVTADGAPKLLDFGIAKLLHPQLPPQEAPPTEDWQRMMTPEYASPEQILGRPVTTASDVFSLGLLLYKLLAGRLPDREDEDTAPLPLGEVTVGPSAALGDDAVAVARARRRTPAQLRRELSGDLDDIVLMALRQEPRRRYGSAAQLAADLRRHLDGLPVVAHPDSLVYRAGKALRRHRVLAATGAASFVLLALSAALLAVQSARLAEERDRARRERDEARRMRERRDR